MGNKGQGAIEAILALPLILGSFVFLLLICYHCGLYFITSYYAEEALLCGARQRNVSSCEYEFNQRFLNLTVLSKPVRARMRKSSRQILLQVIYNEFEFQRELKLPLEGNLK